MTTALPTNLNPYADRGPWGRILIDDVDLFPLVIESIDGAEKPEDWNAQKGTGSSGATNVWKGTKLAEAIEIMVVANDLASFNRLYTVRDKLRPSPGKKPPSLTISNGVINFNQITRIAQSLIGQPKWRDGAKSNWAVKLTLTEYDPSKTANTGPAGAAKWKEAGSTANDDAEAELKKTIDKAKSV